MNFTWTVVQMERNASNNFVTLVHYNVLATEDKLSASTYGTVSFTQEEGSYVPFEQLTPELVVGWVQESLGKDIVEESLATQVTAQKNPTTESGLPWAQAVV